MPAEARPPPRWLSAEELEDEARRLLPASVYDYVAGGAGEEQSLRENRLAFERLRLRPRVLTGTAGSTAKVTLWGRQFAAPLFVAPMGGPSHELVRPGGVDQAAAGAADADVGYMVSASSVPTLELPGQGLVCQVYLNDRDATLRLLKRAEALGYLAACLTVDVPTTALRRRNLRHNVAVPDPGGRATNGGFANPSAYARAVTWDDVAWLVSVTSLPLLVKGLMTAEDARLAAEAGAAGVVVSNHGGRQLDATMGTVDALPEVVRAVGGEVSILLDGGVRSSTDIAIALALGADAVGIGKAVMWALAAGGREGVANYLRFLTEDLERSLTLLGVADIGGLTAAHVDRRLAPA